MTTESLKHSIVTSFESCSALREQWDRLCVETDSPVYMSYDWLQLWWRFYGVGSLLRILIFRAADEIVAIAPLYVTRVGFPPFHIRVARLVGANIPPKVFNPPVLPEVAARVWQTVLNHFLTQECCDLVSIGPLSETYAAFDGMKQAAEHCNSSWGSCAFAPRDVHTTYYLPRTFDELFASIDGKERKIRRRKLRELESKGPIWTEVVKDPAVVEEEFESFVKLHAAQWEAEGRPGHFGAWPMAIEYNRALVKAHGRLGRVRFVRLMVGHELVASQYNYAFGSTLYAELPARLAGSKWDRLSLGCSSQVKLLEVAIQERFARMQSGLGHYDYKVLLGGREHDAVILRACSTRSGSLARSRGCYLIRDLTMLLSRKIWYKRISPAMPKFMRSGQSKRALAYDF